ncbi:bifunctional 3-(3-hydroxy-phenyl)propionate/3-hydroxycinnamic acid hydroxylase [Polaromonas sp. SM01]|uniref:bifunctional 3-(3-hydroxy-phenyl)propionate/3-hydroxycinnamic acid hydroxylase n=1 Tax=Polaromonas sp. SM01 TaxID=3085630 RepID=UPI0029815C4E|nr:bifunctional 3-(3-hydroxy-phenyl)propionate/3-hydroxycinnamic acid hydroxylase [Polaromonas sp. SM01]MDW5441135.1 bifunctional 3-(3-hydroxy-phenyl)propionate/3-hydroxycinnamic acid hydroxylase [Polaromonas sp. SM01]
MTQPVYDVAIVGFGPTGAVAAALLGRRGLRTFVCDRQHEVYDKPRAIALDHEIMRVFQELGLADELAAFMEPFTDSLYYGVDGALIKRMSTVAPPYPLGYPPSLVFTQPRVEQVLRRHVGTLASVTVALGQTVTGLQQSAEHATLSLRDEQGSASTVQARYVIACDGASSTLRGLAGLELHDLGFDEPWLVVDVLVNEHGLAKLPVHSAQYCEPQRPCSYLIGPGKHRRWEISINAGEDPQHLATPEGTWPLLARWITPQDATLWRQASYRFHALVAREWRSGRVFLAGDAAHQQPPFLGQGMCQGIRDVANLCWKLDAVLAGKAPDALLDTYSPERKTHVTELTSRIKHIGQLIGERDPAAARERDQALLAQAGGAVQPTPRQDVQPSIAGVQASASCLAGQTHAARGTLFPQPWILRPEGRARLDQLAGTGWRLVLAAGASSAVRDSVQQHATTSALTLVDIADKAWLEADGVVANWMARHQCQAALVRPDHYVFGVAHSADGVDELLAGWAQHAARTAVTA